MVAHPHALAHPGLGPGPIGVEELRVDAFELFAHDRSTDGIEHPSKNHLPSKLCDRCRRRPSRWACERSSVARVVIAPRRSSWRCRATNASPLPSTAGSTSANSSRMHDNLSSAPVPTDMCCTPNPRGLTKVRRTSRDSY